MRISDRPAAAGCIRALVVLAALLPVAAAAAPPTPVPEPTTVVSVFTLRNRRAEEAAPVVRPYLTARGSLLLQGGPNSITVRDVPAAVRRIERALSFFDRLRDLSVSVTLLKEATGGEPAAAGANVSEEIRGVGERLRKLFRATSFLPLDSVVVRGQERSPVAYAIGTQFRLEFVPEIVGEEPVVRLRDLVFSRQRSEQGRTVSRELLRTTINVSLDRPYVLGIGKDETATGALFLVFSAVVPGPGLGGAN